MAEVKRISDRLENREKRLRIREWLMARRHLGRNARSVFHAADMPTGLQVLVWALLVALAVALSLHAFQTYQLGTHFDDAHYVILTRSLIRSDQYGMIHEPGQPGVPRYPFGYPLLLAPAALVFPDNLDALKALSLIATVANSFLLFWGWRWFSRRSHWWALAIVGLYVLSPLAIDHTRRVMSEPIFTTVCLAALLLAERAARGQQSRWGPLWMGIVLIFVMFTRTVGIVVVLSVFAYLLLRKRRAFWREFVAIVAVMTLTSGLVVSLTSVQPKDLLPLKYLGETAAVFVVSPIAAISGNPSDYVSSKFVEEDASQAGKGRLNVKRLLTGYARGARQHLEEDFRTAVLPLGGGFREQAFARRLGISSLPILVGLVAFALVVMGFFRWFAQEGLSAFNLFAVVYCAVLFVWVWKGPRLLYPVQPPLQFAFLLGLEATLIGVTGFRKSKGSLRTLRNGVLALVVIVLMLVSAHKSLTIEDSRLFAGDIEARSRWIKANTSPSAVIMTEAPPVEYVYSGRKAVSYPTAGSASELEDSIMNRQVDYILVAPDIDWMDDYYVASYSERMTRILPLLQELAAENRIKLVFSSEQELIEVFETQY
jgi:4-amino-4-deoxy-L-arabinose transferase-like glycosyltransferase